MNEAVTGLHMTTAKQACVRPVPELVASLSA